MMKKYNYKTIFIAILLLLNFISAMSFIKYFNKYNELQLFSINNKKQIKEFQVKYDYRTFHVYNEIFNKKKDSIYSECFYYEYVEHPIDAYLLANTYYNLTKKKYVLKHIDLAKEQLDKMYGED